MTDPASRSNAGDEVPSEVDRRSTEGTPRWVKVFGIVAVLIVLLFVVLLIAGGPHNPGRHMGVHGSQTSLAAA
jgi:hypothetical protein